MPVMGLGAIAASVLNFAHRQVDRIMPPAIREGAYARTKEFAMARPMLFSFILTQAAFSIFPILCFLTFSFSVFFTFFVIFLIATLFWIGVALLVLIPILIFTSGTALFTWGFGAATFIFGQWIYTALCGNTPNINEESSNHRRKKELVRARLSPPAEPPSSSVVVSAEVERQPTDQDDKSEAQQKESAHPNPDFDVDAIEP